MAHLRSTLRLAAPRCVGGYAPFAKSDSHHPAPMRPRGKPRPQAPTPSLRPRNLQNLQVGFRAPNPPSRNRRLPATDGFPPPRNRRPPRLPHWIAGSAAEKPAVTYAFFEERPCGPGVRAPLPRAPLWAPGDALQRTLRRPRARGQQRPAHLRSVFPGSWTRRPPRLALSEVIRPRPRAHFFGRSDRGVSAKGDAPRPVCRAARSGRRMDSAVRFPTPPPPGRED